MAGEAGMLHLLPVLRQALQLQCVAASADNERGLRRCAELVQGQIHLNRQGETQ